MSYLLVAGVALCYTEYTLQQHPVLGSPLFAEAEAQHGKGTLEKHHMTAQESKLRAQHILTPLPNCDPTIGRALAALEEARHRTRRALTGLDPSILDWHPKGVSSIGALLYHVAAIEIDWLQTDVHEGKPLPDSLWAMFEVDVRDESGYLTLFKGDSLEAHWARLDAVRAALIESYCTMSVEEFRRPRALPDYDVTPEFVIHHLIQHEAEHRAEIGAVQAQAE